MYSKNYGDPQGHIAVQSQPTDSGLLIASFDESVRCAAASGPTPLATQQGAVKVQILSWQGQFAFCLCCLPFRQPCTVAALKHQVLSLDWPTFALAETSNCAVAPAYSIVLAVAVEKLPAFASMTLPNLEGGLWTP